VGATIHAAAQRRSTASDAPERPAGVQILEKFARDVYDIVKKRDGEERELQRAEILLR
jgi:hypothetical protein